MAKGSEADSRIVEQFNALPLKTQKATLDLLWLHYDRAQSRVETPKFIALVRREIAKEAERLSKMSKEAKRLAKLS